MTMMLKRIGIVGGIGPAATILYYRKIIEGCHALRSDGRVPEIVIYSLDLKEINEYFYENALSPLSEKLIHVVTCLQNAGCDFAVFACNTMHMVFDRVSSAVSLPMIDLIRQVIDEGRRQQLSKVGLLGTTFVMKGPLYKKALEKAGIECVVPEDHEQEWIMNAIQSDLQQPVVPKSTIDRLLGQIAVLGQKGAQAVVLACTDLPVAITPENSPLPLIDSTDVHVRAVLEYAMATDSERS